ncbi:MAG: saccharopine dehydrogenase NADP-binding domain-containing protein [Polyangiaceae bacterium]
MRPIVVYGASGYTGTMIAKELHSRGVRVVLGGRDANALRRVANELGPDVVVRAASVGDGASLRALVAGCSVVVNAAGPFSVTGRPLLEAALSSGSHYVDIGADPFVMQSFFDEYDDEAQRVGSAVLAGASFYFMLSDLLAHRLSEGHGILESIDVAYALDRWNFTPGSLTALWDMVGKRLEYVGGSLRPTAARAALSTFAFSDPTGAQVVFAYPGGDVVTIPRHVSANNVTVSMSAKTFAPSWSFKAVPAFLRALQVVSRSWLGPVLRRLSARLPRRDLEARRATTRFTVEVHAEEQGKIRAASIHGRHMYGLGAWLTADVAWRLSRGEVAARGVLAPSQAFDAATYLAELARHELIDEIATDDCVAHSPY